MVSWMSYSIARIAAVALAVAIFVAVAADAAQAKYASIVIDVETGEVLYSRNADTRNYPASLTKMMTLYLTFEALESGSLRLDQPLKVSRRAAGQAPSKLGLAAGSTISVEDAILALVTKSANDIATVLAEALGGTEWEFAVMMTEKARALGMANTSFKNASGLPNRKQLSSARDMGNLAIALMQKFPSYYHYFSVTEFRFNGKTYKNHNNLLANYPGTDGLKTGYIAASGFNVAVSVTREGHRLIGVVFGGKTAKSRDTHMAELLDKSFARLDERRLYAEGDDVEVQLVVASMTTGDPWGIQIGAYSTVAAATRALDLAERHLNASLAGAAAALMPIEANGKTLIRARYLGMNEDTAEAACDRLSGSDLPCAVIRVPDSERAETTRS
jgi:D-alanyl-D-alanine carboxypeptidase